jgi:very-short-patch-repair endonuclease
MTPPEAAIWLRLRQRKPGRRTFRRQHAIGPYILDFYCAALNLAVEVDGSTHYAEQAVEHDARRTAWLATQGIEVIRILASDVLRNADTAAEYIWHAAAARLASRAQIP